MKRSMKKFERITFRLTAEQKRQLSMLASHCRKTPSAYLRDLALAEIGKWSTVVATEEGAETKELMGRVDQCRSQF